MVFIIYSFTKEVYQRHDMDKLGNSKLCLGKVIGWTDYDGSPYVVVEFKVENKIYSAEMGGINNREIIKPSIGDSILITYYTKDYNVIKIDWTPYEK